MSERQDAPTKFGFVKTFVLPALLIFLIPVLSLLFFIHAQRTFNGRVREALLQQVNADQSLSAEERAQLVELYTTVPFSRLISHAPFAEMVSGQMRTYFATFRWMILLSLLSIVSGILVFLFTGVCVLFSLRSALAQYISLSVGWHILRIHGALQTIIQGILLVALSFWVTALWTDRYFVKLIFLAGAAAVLACVAVIVAIFKRVKPEFELEGEVLSKDETAPVWKELQAICAKVGTEPPDQVIVGIDNNFFVTEQPVIVDGQTCHGRTLFVSLSLLKQLQGSEADAVLAHEMAHFSGKDTLYSRKISPLLTRYGHYLEGLHSGGITLPIFYYMVCFRALYEVSLSRHSRQREFRADKIAADTTSARDLAGALLRIVAYSKYRHTVESELFKQEEALESANISERIEQGFPQYATAFSSETDIGEMSTAHPFDSHPPLAQRLEAVEFDLKSAEAQRLLSLTPDGAWYRHIRDAEQMERRQWTDFEQRFRDYHEQTLPYRFLPETEAELAIVLKGFPEISIDGKDGRLTLDYAKVAYGDKWPAPIRYSEVTGLNLNEGVLTINYGQGGKQKQTLKTKIFGDRQQEVLDALNRYYGRYVSAKAYQEQKKLAAAASTS